MIVEQQRHSLALQLRVGLQLAIGNIELKARSEEVQRLRLSFSPSLHQSRLCQLTTVGCHSSYTIISTNSSWVILLLIRLHWEGSSALPQRQTTICMLRALRCDSIQRTHGYSRICDFRSAFLAAQSLRSITREIYTCLLQASLRTGKISITYSSIYLSFQC